MCTVCGCGSEVHHDAHAHGPTELHDHHSHQAEGATLLTLERDVLAKNDELARHNREHFASRQIFALNVMSSPGSGKTTLLERTITTLPQRRFFVVEGDQATDHDAQRIRATGAAAFQINTGAGCHLDAAMVHRALHELDPTPGSTVVIENVGNLVCPALFDLGEAVKVVVASVTEGEDKPLKYPHMFRQSSVILLNKIDLLPHLQFDVERFRQYAHQVQPKAEVLCVSATTGEGFGAWHQWLGARA